MAKPVFLVKVPELKASARFTLRFPWLIALLFAVLCAASFSYTIQNLGIRNNTAELLSQDLPFQQVRLKLEKAFPLDAAAIIIVIESETPEHTTMAADFVRQRLQGQPGYFDSAYIPDDNPFFRQQGFLYLDLDELEDLSDRLTDAQPFIGHLSQNFHVAGLVDIISLALEAEDKASSLPLEPLLSAIDRTLIKVKSKQIHFLSWQQLMTENSFGRDQTRRLVILNSMSTVGRSLFLCALTTAIGFFAFIPTDFKKPKQIRLLHSPRWPTAWNRPTAWPIFSTAYPASTTP